MNSRLAKLTALLTIASIILIGIGLILKSAAGIALKYTVIYMWLLGIGSVAAAVWGCIFVTYKARDSWWKIPAYILIGAACGFLVYVAYIGGAMANNLGYKPYMSFTNPENNITVTVFEGGYLNKTYIAQKSAAGIFYYEQDNGYVGFAKADGTTLDDQLADSSVEVVDAGFSGGAAVSVEWQEDCAVITVTSEDDGFVYADGCDGTLVVEY